MPRPWTTGSSTTSVTRYTSNTVPGDGLDLAAAAELRNLLGELRGAGRVLVLATHNVDEGVEHATDVAFQRKGRFVQLAARGERGAAEIAAAYRRAVNDACAARP